MVSEIIIFTDVVFQKKKKANSKNGLVQVAGTTKKDADASHPKR